MKPKLFVLAIESPGSLVILDDRLGRLLANHLGLNLKVIGTLGVLLIAKRKGLIKTISPEIDRLQERVGFRIGKQQDSLTRPRRSGALAGRRNQSGR